MDKNIQNLINEINIQIEAFNKLLDKSLSLNIFPTDDSISKDKNCWVLKNIDWKNTRFPNSEYAGVYVIIGRNFNKNDNLGVYIGKASMNSYLGRRLNSHLNQKTKNERQYFMYDKKNTVFEMDFVLTVPCKGEIYFLATALEEFLITRLNNKIHLLNSIGNNF